MESFAFRSSTPHGSGTIQTGIFYFPLYLRFVFLLGFPPHLHYYWFWNPVSNCGLQAYPACPCTILYGLHSKMLLRPRASPVPGATTTASTFPRQWRPAGRLDLSPRPALLLVLQSCFQLRSSSVPSVPLHYSMVCTRKCYFGHEHHLFQERPLLLLHSLASGVLLVDWTCLLALHYYWFCTPVFDCGRYLAGSSTSTLLSALQKRLLRAPASPVP
ncbi:uncharacterized protein [Dermacentor andersoni]|uniref:uncharacterized protein isoform X2 n=1 Tax=Dermacentor andersoni TaxID=34620 RepID=UPI002416036A|nr:uncharacterized protein LOC126531254 isoform X2 [Dermacentor andersoni]